VTLTTKQIPLLQTPLACSPATCRHNAAEDMRADFPATNTTGTIHQQHADSMLQKTHKAGFTAINTTGTITSNTQTSVLH